MSTKIFSLYGANGCGRDILAFAKPQAKNLEAKLYFIDDKLAGSIVNEVPVIAYKEFLKLEAAERYVCITIADPKIRQRLAFLCQADALKNWSLAAPNVFLGEDIQLGEGSVLCPFTCITANVKIGKFFHANLYSYVAHDCVIGDFVTFAPAVKCNGNVVIENNAFIGTGAIIKQGSTTKPLVIGENAIVGMGAVVTKNVAANTLVVGNPARLLIKECLLNDKTTI